MQVAVFIRVSLITIITSGLLTACGSADNSGAAAGDSRVKLTANNSYAEFGEYVIHVNAMTTAELTPEVAQSYGIARSKNQGLVNLVVLAKSADTGVDVPVASIVTVSASNLTGQLKTIEMREVVDTPSIYYIGEVAVDDRETINFDFDVQPSGSSQLLLIRYSQQFYTR